MAGDRPDLDQERRLRWALGAVGVILALVIGVAAYVAFPVMDDGEILTTAREAGAAQLITAYRDRPLCGWLTEAFVARFRETPVAWVVVGLVAWGLLAGQTVLLMRGLAPCPGSGIVLAVCLVASPIVVQTQFATISMVLPGNAAVSLALAAILVTLKRGGVGPGVLSGLLAAGGALISEYSIATLAAGVVLLVALRRGSRTAFPLAGGFLGHFVYRLTSDTAARPETAPASQLALALRDRSELLPHWFNGLWHSVAGAYGWAAGAVKLDGGSRSSLLAAVVGLVVALLVGFADRGAEPEAVPDRRVIRGLLAGILAGLLPVVLANRDPSLNSFDSRFRLPILPFAVAATVFLLQTVAASRWRRVLFALFAFVAGFTVVTSAFRAAREQLFFDEVGRQILDIAGTQRGIVMVVVPEGDYALPWTKIVRRFPVEPERHVFTIYERYAESWFGSRSSCNGRKEIDVPPTLRVMGRSGPVSTLLRARWAGRVVLEPYCLEPR